jgi:HSP20 family protein
VTRRREDIERLESIQELIEDLWQVPRFARAHARFRPNVDVYRTEEPPQLVVVCELAGVAGEDVRLELGEQALVIAGERRRPPAEGPRTYQQVEVEYGHFHRRIPLPAEVDGSRAEAVYDRGVLTIRLPLPAKRARRRSEPAQVRLTISVIRP